MAGAGGGARREARRCPRAEDRWPRGRRQVANGSEAARCGPQPLPAPGPGSWPAAAGGGLERGGGGGLEAAPPVLVRRRLGPPLPRSPLPFRLSPLAQTWPPHKVLALPGRVWLMARGRGRHRHEPLLGSARVWGYPGGEPGHGGGGPGDRGGGGGGGGGREVGDAARRGSSPLAPGPAPRRIPSASKVWSHGRRAPVPPRTVPSAVSVPPLLPGQDKGSLTRDGTALHKWDRSEREPETERERRERQGPHEPTRRRAPGLAENGGPGGASGRNQRRAPGRGEARGRRGRQSRSLSRAGARGRGRRRAGCADRPTYWPTDGGTPRSTHPTRPRPHPRAGAASLSRLPRPPLPAPLLFRLRLCSAPAAPVPSPGPGGVPRLPAELSVESGRGAGTFRSSREAALRWARGAEGASPARTGGCEG